MILEEKLLQVIHDEDVHILLCGDFNARTGCEQPKLDDMSNYTPGSEEDVIRGDWADRQPKDIVVNNFGKSLMILCFMIDCAFLNSCCKGHRSEEYTYVSPHGSCVIDYFPMSEDLFSANCNMRVGDRVDSWHMPVELCWNNVVHSMRNQLLSKAGGAYCMVR